MVVVGNARQRIMCGGIADGMPVAVKTSGFGKYRRRTGFGILKRPGKTLGAGRNIVIGRVSHARVGHCQVGFAARQGAQRHLGRNFLAGQIEIGQGLLADPEHVLFGLRRIHYERALHHASCARHIHQQGRNQPACT